MHRSEESTLTSHHFVSSPFAWAAMLAVLAMAASPVAGQAGYDHSAFGEHMACVDAGGNVRDCAIESGFMDADTYDRTIDFQDCLRRGGEPDACRIESGLATEGEIQDERTAQQVAVAYLTRLIERAVASGDPVLRLSALELAVALRPDPGAGKAVVDEDRLEAWIQALATDLEAGLGHDPALLAGLLRACQGMRCGGGALFERIHDLEPGNLHWFNHPSHPLRDDPSAWLHAAATADTFNDRQWDAARRIARMMEITPPPHSLFTDASVGAGVSPQLYAFATAFALAGDLNVVRLGGGPLQRACREPTEDLRDPCFAIGDMKFTHGGTLNLRRVGTEMMQASAWNDDTRSAAEHAARVIDWQRTRQSDVLAGSGAGSAVDDLVYMREVVMEDGATEVDLLLAQFERAGVPWAPPVPSAD